MTSLRVHPVSGEGSGFIINKDGFILTNAHVVLGSQEIIPNWWHIYNLPTTKGVVISISTLI